MLLTYEDIMDLLDQGVVDFSDPDHITKHTNGASLDITLGRYVLYEDPRGGVIDLAHGGTLNVLQHDLLESPFELHPGGFVLAQSQEVFNLPSDIAFELKLKSSQARNALGHLLAGWADPWWHDSVLTLEYKNESEYHTHILRYGMKAGQMVFWRGKPVPKEFGYATKGRYNGDRTVQASKGVQ